MSYGKLDRKWVYSDEAWIFAVSWICFDRKKRQKQRREKSIEDRIYGDAIGHRPLRGRCPKRRVDAVEAKEGPDVKQQLVYHGWWTELPLSMM